MWNRRRAARLWGTGAGIVLVGVVLLAAWRWGEQRSPVVSTQFLMDTVVEQKLYGRGAERGMEEAEALIRSIEQNTSLFRTDSEVSRINNWAGVAPVRVSAGTFELIDRAVNVGESSGGAFDITTAPLKALWDVTGEHPRVPEQAAIDALLPLVDYRDVVLDRVNQTVFLRRRGQKIDLGGIAKGYAAEQCAELYRSLGLTGYISIGGNVAVVGAAPDGREMRFGVRCPREGNAAYLGSAPVRDGTMATSGDYERFFMQDGKRYHHILDPGSGYPAESDLISVSVISPDGAMADALSTALFLGGSGRLEDLRGTLPEYEYIAVDRDKAVYVSEGLRGEFTLNPDAADEYYLAGEER